MADVYEVGTENGKCLSGDSDILVGHGHVEVIGDKGFRNEVSGLETDCIVLGSAMPKDSEVKGVNEEVNIKRGSNGNHLEVEKVNVSENIVVETTDLDSGKNCSLDNTQTNTQQPATESVKSENKNGEVPQVTAHQCTDVLDDKQAEFEVKEPILIFPDTLQCPEIKIHFGTFGVHEKDPKNLNLVLEVSNREAEPICGVSINNPETILDDLQNKSADKATHEAVKGMDDVVQPYNFLMRVPRFDDEELKEQIKNAQLQFDEKIRCRYAIWVEIQENRAVLKAHSEALKNADLEIIAAMELRKSKRRDLESIQYFMKKVTDAEDIDNWHMHKAEDMIEIVNQKKQIEKLLNNIGEEVDSLQDNVVKAKLAALVIGEIYDEEYEKGKEIRAQFQVADDVCQQAYTHLNSLKKRLYDKKKNFYYMYKEDTTATRNFASGGDKVALRHHCANQEERIMEEWNSNEEFRKDYISRITPSTLVETLRESDMSEKIAVKSVPIPSETESVSVLSKAEQWKKTASTPENQTVWKVARKTNRTMKTRERVEFVVRDSKFVCLSEIMEDEQKEKTMVEVDKKEDESSKKEIECNLKVQMQLEEKRKMDEVTERKKRNAENAQKRLELRAQKEAEQRQAREKRLKRKERKRTVGDNRVNDEKIVKLNEEDETEKPRAAIHTIGDILSNMFVLFNLLTRKMKDEEQNVFLQGY